MRIVSIVLCFVIIFFSSSAFALNGVGSLSGVCSGENKPNKLYDGGILNINCPSAISVGKFYLQTNTFFTSSVCSPSLTVKVPFSGKFDMEGGWLVGVVFEDMSFPFTMSLGPLQTICNSEVSPIDDSFAVLLGGVFALCFSLAFATRLV